MERVGTKERKERKRQRKEGRGENTPKKFLVTAMETTTKFEMNVVTQLLSYDGQMS